MLATCGTWRFGGRREKTQELNSATQNPVLNAEDLEIGVIGEKLSTASERLSGREEDPINGFSDLKNPDQRNDFGN